MSSSNSQLSGRKLRAHIQKKPFTQKLNGIDYTYAILPKKQKTFVLTHERFLVLKGIESISYARAFPDGTNLPFKSAIELPQPKGIYKISEIQRFYTDQQKLLIHFSGEDRQSWEFVCPSKVCAHEWRKRIEEAIAQFNDYKQSKYEKYEEYLEMKRREEETEVMRRNKLKEQMISQSLGNGIMNSAQFQPQAPQPLTDSKQNQLASSIVNVSVSPKEPSPPVPIEPQLSEIKIPQTPSIEPHFTFSSSKKQEPMQQKPNPDDIDILDRLIKNNPSPSQPVFKKSPSSLSVAGKETIRAELSGYRRDWLNELVGIGQESELVMDFRAYVQKIVEVLINELYIPQQNKVFPYREWHRDFANFVLEDVYIEVYFYGEEQIEKKHEREAKTSREFKNYDYLLEATKNEGILLTPFMVLFEYKGFTGMARTRVGNQNSPYENKNFYNEMDVEEFVQNSRINPQILLDESKCKIVSYQPPRTRLNEKIEKVYFIERFNDFLPYEISEVQQEKYQLRPELIQDRELDEYVFGDKEREAGTYEVETLIDKKIDLFVKAIQRGEEYFTNSKELADIVHSFGLNIRHYGLILRRVKQVWFKKILKAQMAARSLKNYFRFDLQNCVINQTERIDLRQKQSQRQKKRVISFLNVVFGNSEPTYHIWRGLNRYSKKHFQMQIWEDHFEDQINVCYFLQALQSHLKITLSDEIHQKVYFKSANSMAESDFLRFDCNITYYNLDFTEKFQQIYSYLQDKSAESFSQICRIMEKEVSKGKPYLFVLKQHPIYYAICEYFLYFISIDDYPNVYNKIEEVNFPSRFVYECHLTQIKWFIKQNQLQNVSKPVKFIVGSGKKWLGDLHPLFVRMNRVLAESYLQNSDYYSQALNYANESIRMQQIMNGGDVQWLWKDYYLLGRIHFNKGYYDKALSMVSRARELAIFEHVTDFESYGEMMVTLCKCFLANNMLLDSYILARQLYNQLRDERSEGVLSYLVECVSLMKTLLERNQQHEAYYKFVETDFSHLLIAFVGNNKLLAQSIKLIIVPYLKNSILHRSNNRSRISLVIQELRKINLTTFSCSSYLQAKIKEGKFPQRFLNILKDIDKGLEEIQGHNMVERWVAFNKMSNQTLLERIGGAQIDKGFEFLADFTAILGLLGEDMDKQFIFMQK